MERNAEILRRESLAGERLRFLRMTICRYLHRNPVKRGLVKKPGDWKWSSFRHYALREIGIVEIESEWTARDRETKTWGGAARLFLKPS